MSLGSKYDEVNEFYALLNAFINTHEAITTETKDRKNRILNNVNQLYNKYFDAYRKNYSSEKVKEEVNRGRHYEQFEIIDNRGQELKSTWQRRPRQKNLMKCKNHYGLNQLKKRDWD